MYLQANDITKRFSNYPILDHLNLQLEPGEKSALIGVNGSGKTTLFEVLLGIEGVDAGSVSQQKGLRIGYVQQQTANESVSVMTYLLRNFSQIGQLSETLHYYEKLMTDPQQDLTAILPKYSRVQEDYEAAGGYTLAERLQSILKGVGLGDLAEAPLDQLSGGEKVKVELAKALAQEADLYLLDEPTNHLDLAGILWLEEFLKHTKAAFLVISHDRAFLDHVTTKTYQLEDGQLKSYPGNYSRFRFLKQAELEKLQKDYDLQQKEIKRLQRLIRQYRQWGVESDNPKFFKKAKEVAKRLERLTVIKRPQPQTPPVPKLSASSRSGNEVLLARGIGCFAGEKLLFADSDFAIYRGDKVALLGDNGAGKTTLVQTILQQHELADGELKRGASLQIGYLPQHIRFAQPQQRLLAYAMSFMGAEEPARRLLARYGFPASEVTKRLQDLSGGETVRLVLAKLAQQAVNLLILDEPTNHLDIEAKEEIEQLIHDYQGTLLAISHDRYFLEQNFDQYLLIKDQQIQQMTTLPIL
ncbi:ribosomal protection-like ABC-F family protein [Lapidilactobacillus luobeiensis]|uniref:ribosomal protection-like ABC-F family protein n=1 Tax=Lapidilactobacillus luobeiensis TaxID=2950371 RepID=UPI0021C45343|nr:ABC-F family ATP-binding cassette domain-containing protein [Lapidilactobacillus luobeiensis]